MPAAACWRSQERATVSEQTERLAGAGTPSMNDKEFVDTNIFIYAFDRTAGRKRTIAVALLEHLWLTCAGCVSLQILQEYRSPGVSHDTDSSTHRSFIAMSPVRKIVGTAISRNSLSG